MATKICAACLGCGSYLATEWVRGDPEAPHFQRIVVRKRCEFCRPAAPEPHGARLLDGLYGWLLAAAGFGYVGFQMASGNSGPDQWLRVGGALGATLVLAGASGGARIRRWGTLLLLVSAMLADITLRAVAG